MSWRESCKSLNFEEHGKGQMVNFWVFFFDPILARKRRIKRKKPAKQISGGFEDWHWINAVPGAENNSRDFMEKKRVCVSLCSSGHPKTLSLSPAKLHLGKRKESGSKIAPGNSGSLWCSLNLVQL